MSEAASKTVEAVTAATAKITYGTAGTAVLFGLNSNQITAIAAMGGLAIAMLTYLTNIYFNYKRLQIERKKHEKDTTTNG